MKIIFIIISGKKAVKRNENIYKLLKMKIYFIFLLFYYQHY